MARERSQSAERLKSASRFHMLPRFENLNLFYFRYGYLLKNIEKSPGFVKVKKNAREKGILRANLLSLDFALPSQRIADNQFYTLAFRPPSQCGEYPLVFRDKLPRVPGPPRPVTSF